MVGKKMPRLLSVKLGLPRDIAWSQFKAGAWYGGSTLTATGKAASTGQFMRDNWLSNRVFKSYDDILDHCCFAWHCQNPGKGATSPSPRLSSGGCRS
jgi:hypothetical protein